MLARDGSLTLERQTGTSILNIFPAQVAELSEAGPSQVLVRLWAQDASLLARVTRRSARLLDLQPGKDLYAQVKSVAFVDGSGPARLPGKAVRQVALPAVTSVKAVSRL